MNKFKILAGQLIEMLRIRLIPVRYRCLDLPKRGLDSQSLVPLLLLERKQILLISSPPHRRNLNLFRHILRARIFPLYDRLLQPPRGNQEVILISELHFGDVGGVALERRVGLFLFADWVPEQLHL
jgi:hypothetical protein